MRIIDNINEPNDIKKLTLFEKENLANECRDIIIDSVSKSGGHLASNLGVVDLTIALFSSFNLPHDKIIWDVGHQCYTHKMLTGRKDLMNTLRKYNGIAGFPKTNESEYDAFNTGHSSTSISVALGMANANKLLNNNNRIIAVIGDGALTGGMAMEALNDAGSSNANVIVILNDNGMSISKNVGGITNLLTIIRLKKTYHVSNNVIKRMLNKVPYIGTGIVKVAHKIKKSIKQLLIPNMYFEDIGFTYLGPVDGHDIQRMEKLFKKANNIKGPILIHVVTKKGKGYLPAEQNPDKFHAVSNFNKDDGNIIKKGQADYSKIFGEKLLELAKKDNKIVAVTAAMRDGTGLESFSKAYPERFFDVGIAEQHAVGMISGMAKEGLKPVFAVYSSFLQRAYDQLIHDVAIQNLPVTICIDRAGVVGADGETHQGLFDMSYLSNIPNFVVMAPSNFCELEQMLEFAINLNKPVAVRYPRGSEGKNKTKGTSDIQYGKAEILADGNDLTIIAIGKMVEKACVISELLNEHGVHAQVINARFLKPLDESAVLESVKNTKKVVTIEDGLLNGGLASTVERCIAKNNLEGIKIKSFGYDDVFVTHASVEQIEEKYGLDEKNIVKEILTFLK